MNLSNNTIPYTTRPSSISQDSIIDSDEITIIEITNHDTVDKLQLHNVKNHKQKISTPQRIFIDTQNTHIPVNDLLVTHREIYIDSNTPAIINPYSLELSNINQFSYVNDSNCNPCLLIILLTIFVLLFITIYRNT